MEWLRRLFRRKRAVSFGPGAFMKAKDPEFYETIRSMSVPEALRAWFKKYPEDIPDRWKGQL